MQNEVQEKSCRLKLSQEVPREREESGHVLKDEEHMGGQRNRKCIPGRENNEQQIKKWR